MRFSAVIVAAGMGARMGGSPKQWRLLWGRSLVEWSIEAMTGAGAQSVVVVVAQDQIESAQALLGPRVKLTAGGATRTESVKAGIAALDDAAEVVMIHDAARPLVTRAHIERLMSAMEQADGAILAVPVSDTLKRGQRDHTIAGTADREGLWRAQTPQAFKRAALTDAYARWPNEAAATDDAAVVEAAGGRVALVPGDVSLMKVTYAEDFEMIERLAGAARVTRVGQGVDAHRFGPGDTVWLCGVPIQHHQTLVGHSDADAGLHALTDAILGAIGEGDIGDHFPPTDPKWRGAPSDLFLTHAVDLVKAKGGRIVNVDLTLICEQPKIKPHRLAMRERLAALLDLPLDRVSVKATTTEGMGFTGRGEGLAAQALASVETPA